MIRIVASGRYVPPDVPAPEPRHIDVGEWTPVDTRGFFKGLVLFLLGAAVAWALLRALT